MTSSLALSPVVSQGLGDGNNRVRPDAQHCVDEREVLGIEDEERRKRARLEEVPLETEATIDPEAMKIFEETMASRTPPITRERARLGR